MISFALLKNNKLFRIIKCPNENQNNLKILEIMFDDFDIIEINKNTNYPRFINSEYIDGKFYDPRPYPSWVINNEQWTPPFPPPQNKKNYLWDENEQGWKQYEAII